VPNVPEVSAEIWGSIGLYRVRNSIISSRFTAWRVGYVGRIPEHVNSAHSPLTDVERDSAIPLRSCSGRCSGSR
jgi:hypothetical protein